MPGETAGVRYGRDRIQLREGHGEEVGLGYLLRIGAGLEGRGFFEGDRGRVDGRRWAWVRAVEGVPDDRVRGVGREGDRIRADKESAAFRRQPDRRGARLIIEGTGRGGVEVGIVRDGDREYPYGGVVRQGERPRAHRQVDGVAEEAEGVRLPRARL